jgi:hypothetical protein
MIGVLCLAGVLACAGGSTPSEGTVAQSVKLAFVVQPGATTPGSVISPAVQVAVQDAAGNTVPGASANVSIAIAAGRGASGAVLTGTATRSAINGIASFADLAIDRAGTNYALTASAPSLTSATSAGFDVSATTGGTLLLQENFEDGNLASRGWYDNTTVLLSTVERVPGSNSSAQYRYLQGATGPTSGGAQRHKFTPSSSLYVSFYVKYSANWVGSAKPYHPHEFYALSNLDGDFDGPANNWLTIYLEHNYQNGGRPRMSMQDNKAINTSGGTLPNNLVSVTENRSTGGCNGVVESNIVWECYLDGSIWYNDKQLTGPVAFLPNSGAGYKSDWNFVEAYYQLNSIVGGIGQADGIMQYWFNGALLIDRRDIVYRTGARASLQFSQFIIKPYIGDGSPVDQSMFVDNFRLATARIP